MFVYTVLFGCCAAVAVCIVSIYKIQLTMKKTVALRMKCLCYYCVGDANRPCPGATRDVCCTLALLVCVCVRVSACKTGLLQPVDHWLSVLYIHIVCCTGVCTWVQVL